MYYAFDRRWLSSVATVTLVILNILIFAGDLLTDHIFYRLGVLDIGRVLSGHEYNRLVSAMFLHDGIGHLFSNMVLLFYVGAVVERNLGSLPYVLLYLASGTAGNAATVWYEVARNESWTSLGASGAVFGVMGAMLVLLIRVPKDRRNGSSLLPRVAFMVAYSLFMGLRSHGINNVAHVAGLACGALICYVLSLSLKEIDLRALL